MEHDVIPPRFTFGGLFSLLNVLLLLFSLFQTIHAQNTIHEADLPPQKTISNVEPTVEPHMPETALSIDLSYKKRENYCIPHEKNPLIPLKSYCTPSEAPEIDWMDVFQQLQRQGVHFQGSQLEQAREGIIQFLKAKLQAQAVQPAAETPSQPPPEEGKPAEERRVQKPLPWKTLQEKETWRKSYLEKIQEYFNHAWTGYLTYAYPDDELQSLTCTGRNTLGNYSATLIDTLDTFVIMKNMSGFAHAMELARKVTFDHDKPVSVFETNIRIVGGLLSAHLLAKKFNDSYDSFFADKAVEVGRKLLPAFTTTPSGMPYGTVHLSSGPAANETTITCNACVGTFMLEFAWLSLLTNDTIFENTARHAVRVLNSTQSALHLLGNHIDVFTKSWTLQEASIGTGSDSTFEYFCKTFFAFSDEEEFGQLCFEHTEAIFDHLKKGIWHVDVNFKTGQLLFPWHHSLSAFYPGLLVLKGDLLQAQDEVAGSKYILDKSGFLPEAYDLNKGDYLPNRSQYPLRPEFIESVWYLYRATKDARLLVWGAEFVDQLEKTKTRCGFANVNDVTTGELDDKMETFFLSETLKYLWLLFDEENVFNGPEWIFTTEAHPLPVTDRRKWMGKKSWKKWKLDSERARRMLYDNDYTLPTKKPEVPTNKTHIQVMRRPTSPWQSALDEKCVKNLRKRSRRAWRNSVCSFQEFFEANIGGIFGLTPFGQRRR